MVTKNGVLYKGCCGCTPVAVDLECLTGECFSGFNPCFVGMTIANPAPNLGLTSIWWQGSMQNGSFNSADTVHGSGAGLGVPQGGGNTGTTCGGTDATWPLAQMGGVVGIYNTSWGFWVESETACSDGHGGFNCQQFLKGTLYFCVCNKSPAP